MSEKKEKILLVDDEEEFLNMVGLILRKAGYEVVSANSGIEALQILTLEKIDLIILDVKMPGMDGYEVCNRIREDMLLGHIPIIMLTCMRETANRVRGFRDGGDDYISKPFETEELFVRVRNLLERYSRELGANPLSYMPGNIQINNELQRRIDKGSDFSVIYIDLDNLHEYNL